MRLHQYTSLLRPAVGKTPGKGLTTCLRQLQKAASSDTTALTHNSERCIQWQLEPSSQLQWYTSGHRHIKFTVWGCKCSHACELSAPVVISMHATDCKTFESVDRLVLILSVEYVPQISWDCKQHRCTYMFRDITCFVRDAFACLKPFQLHSLLQHLFCQSQLLSAAQHTLMLSCQAGI